MLPVSEIENVILLPTVSRAILESEGYDGAELDARLNSLKAAIFDTLKSGATIDVVVTRYCRRRIDRLLKKIDLSKADDVAALTAEYVRQTSALDIAEIGRDATERIQRAIRDDDLPMLLRLLRQQGHDRTGRHPLKNLSCRILKTGSLGS